MLLMLPACSDQRGNEGTNQAVLETPDRNEMGDSKSVSDLDRLLADRDDFALVNAVFLAVCDEENSVGIESLNVPQRTLLLVWSAGGIIDNGGFQYFFEHDFDGPAVTAAFDEMGSAGRSELVRRALAFFPDSKPHEDRDERLEFLDAMDESTRGRFEELASAFHTDDRDFRRKIGKYVRDHADAFRSLPVAAGEDWQPVVLPAPNATRRQIAEWILTMDGTSIGYAPSDGKHKWEYVRSAGELPPGDVNLVQITFSQYRTDTDELLAHLTKLNNLGSLRSIDLTDTYVTGEGLKHLAALPQVVQLILDETDLHDDDFAVLAAMPQIEELYLTHTPCTDRIFDHVAGMENLTHLGLYGTKVTDSGLAKLAELKSLRDLAVGDAEVTAAGLSALRDLPNLENVELSCEEIDDRTLGELAKIKGLKGLDLCDSLISNKGLHHLRELARLESLSLRNTEIDNAGLAHLRDLTTLKHLDISRTDVTDAGLAHLAKLAHLEELLIEHSQVGGEGLQYLAGMTRLRELSLYEGRATNEGLRHVGKLASLRKLNIKDGLVDNDGIAHLVGLVHLHSLELAGTRVTERGIALLAELKHLEELNLEGTRVTDGIIETIMAFPKLQHVNLLGTEITGKGLAKLTKLEHLHCVYLPDRVDEHPEAAKLEAELNRRHED